MSIEETWCPVPGYAGLYEVSDQGSIRSWHGIGRASTQGIRSKEPRVLKPYLAPDGYYRLNLCRRQPSGIRVVKGKRVHSLVLLAFVGPPPKGHEACHADGDPTNNRLDNLRWDSRFGNKRDEARHERTPRGKAHAKAVLTEDNVREIRALAATRTLTRADIARRFGVSQGTISMVVLRRTWMHVT